jgi:putative oxygen-independent coproporphyrinogen III oxidase
VPFCRRRCDYCAFATWTGREQLWGRYVAACVAEIDQGGAVAGYGRPVTSVFFGGGTPSLLPASLLAEILEAVSASAGLAPGAEVTVECNPETVTGPKLSAYQAAGVTRLSFGVQSMVPHVLASLGREHDPATVQRAAGLAGEAGFGGRYNVDLIFGAAGESLSDWEASLEGVLALCPPPAHVSAYALTVEAGTSLAKDASRHPSEDDQAAKYAMADSALSAAGLSWYEISNWARPGAECAHNQLYWSQGEYAGVGCAAHSHKIFSGSSDFSDFSGSSGSSDFAGSAGARAKRWLNVRSPERYCALVEAGKPVEAAGEVIGPDERAVEALMLSLRTRAGVPAAALPPEIYEEGLAALAGGRGVLTLRGRLLANEVSLRLATVPPSG